MTTQLQALLQRAAASDDLPFAWNAIVDNLDPEDSGAVPVLLAFMEDNPDLDFGTPGAIVHFVEQFYRRGYEAHLVASVSRKPTSHTLWMLNRVINGTHDDEQRGQLIALLRSSAEHPVATAEARETALEFVRHQTD